MKMCQLITGEERKELECEYIVDCNLGKTDRKAYFVPSDYELVFPATSNSMNKPLLGAYACRIWKKINIDCDKTARGLYFVYKLLVIFFSHLPM